MRNILFSTDENIRWVTVPELMTAGTGKTVKGLRKKEGEVVKKTFFWSLPTVTLPHCRTKYTLLSGWPNCTKFGAKVDTSDLRLLQR